jgi:hypothetical protein
MMTHEQVIAYLEETLPSEETAGVEAEFTANAAAATQLTELAQYDSALRTLLNGGAERARIEQSVLAAIREKSSHESEAPGSRQIIKQTPSHRTSNPRKQEDNNMTNPSKSPDDITKAYIKDQMHEQGVEILPQSQTKEAQVKKEQTEEDGQKDARRKPMPAPEAESHGEENDYFNGLSQ